MSHSEHKHQSVGFSTGALERGDYRTALNWMVSHRIRTVELSALRFDELEPLVNGLEALPLDPFDYVSFHAPSSFAREQEERVIDLLMPVKQRGWNIIVHPDVIYTPRLWTHFGELLLVENMDRRKAIGRTVDDLKDIFLNLPQARLCLDVAHARQLDTTLVVLSSIMRTFDDRIAEIHISELDSRCRHQPMSNAAVQDYQQIIGRCFRTAPVIVESMLDGKRRSERMNEIHLAQKALVEA
jgi:hypothetical protein